jgi:hypothetical protein
MNFTRRLLRPTQAPAAQAALLVPFVPLAANVFAPPTNHCLLEQPLPRRHFITAVSAPLQGADLDLSAAIATFALELYCTS